MPRSTSRSRSTSSSPPMRPTSSRSAAGRGPQRGRQLPIAVRPDRVTFRYDGLDGGGAGPRTSRSASRPRPWRPVDPADVAGSVERGLGPARRGAGRSRPARRASSAGSPGRPIDAGARDARERTGDEPDAEEALFPPEPPSATRTRSRPRTTRGTGAFAEIRTDNELFNLAIDRSDERPAPAHQRRPGPSPSATSPRASRGSRRCSGGTRSSPRSRRCASGRSSPIETLEVARLAPGRRRRPGPGRGAGQDPARAADRARWRAPASCRIRPYYGSVDATPLWLILLGGDLRLDGRPGPRRPAVAERAARAGLDRHATATATATGSSSTSGGRRRGLRQPGLEGLGATGSATGTGGSRRRRSRWPRSRATCSTPSAGWPGSPACAATRSSPAGSRPMPRPCGGGSRRRSGPRTRRSTRWPSTARSGRPTRSRPTPATACGPGSPRPTGPGASSTG